MDDYWRQGSLRHAAASPTGYNADPNDPSTMTIRDNFTGFWHLWKDGIIKRDYALLDEIHPNRIRTAEQWFRREEELGRAAGKCSSSASCIQSCRTCICWAARSR